VMRFRGENRRARWGVVGAEEAARDAEIKRKNNEKQGEGGSTNLTRN